MKVDISRNPMSSILLITLKIIQFHLSYSVNLGYRYMLFYLYHSTPCSVNCDSSHNLNELKVTISRVFQKLRLWLFIGFGKLILSLTLLIAEKKVAVDTTHILISKLSNLCFFSFSWAYQFVSTFLIKFSISLKCFENNYNRVGLNCSVCKCITILFKSTAHLNKTLVHVWQSY